MKTNKWTLATVILALIFTPTSTKANPELITFDDIPNSNDYFPPVPNVYAGLDWNNFDIVNPFSDPPHSGYIPGTVSGRDAGFNGFGNPASISSASKFDFDSAYITSAWQDGLSVEIKGYAGGNLIDDVTIHPSATSATFYTFNFDNVDTVDFSSSGGTLHPGYPTGGSGLEQFVIDNITVDGVVVPEPSTWAMLLGGLGLLAFGRWRLRSRQTALA